MNRRLKIRIIELFDTQADFAYHIGCDESLVSRVIHDRIDLYDETKKEWADALECNVSEIFGG